jgi:hypothetical protein
MNRKTTLPALVLMAVVAITPQPVLGQDTGQHAELEAMARITGQWGGAMEGVRWRRSVESAANDTKPLMVLHLFGRLDEEFC